MKAYAPNGSLIIGTYEICPGRSDIEEDSFQRDPETGAISYDYAGWTEFFYDDQKTQRTNGKRVFLDEDGQRWLEDQIKLREEEEQA